MFIQVGFCWGCTLLSFGFLVYPHYRRKIQIQLCLLLGSFKPHRTDAGFCFMFDLWTVLVAPELHIIRDKYMAGSHLLQRTFNWREIPRAEKHQSGFFWYFYQLVMQRAFHETDSSEGVVYLDGAFEAWLHVSACFSFPLITVSSQLNK